MSYYMNAGGSIVLKKSIEDDDALIDEILGYAKKNNLDECVEDTMVGDNLAIDITFDGKYHEEDWTGFLGDIAKYAASGEIECVGEDNSHWRYCFDGTQFVEEYGEIVYEPKKFNIFKPFENDASRATDDMIDKAIKAYEKAAVSVVSQIGTEVYSGDGDGTVSLLERYKAANDHEKAVIDDTLVHLTGETLKTLLEKMEVD